MNYDLVEIKKFLMPYSITVEVIHGKGITYMEMRGIKKYCCFLSLLKFISKGKKAEKMYLKELLYSIVTEEELNEYILKGNRLLKKADKNIQTYSFIQW